MSSTLRSILPHEPLPQSGFGYINIQGSLVPKSIIPKSKKETDEKKKIDLVKDEEKTQIAQQIELKLKKALEDIPPHHQILSIKVHSCCTKVKVTYNIPLVAREMTNYLRNNNISPSDLLQPTDPDVRKIQKYSTKPLQVNQLTDNKLPAESWKYASPPKFRRLLPTPENNKHMDSNKLDELRNTTRYVFLSGLIDEDNPESLNTFQSIMNNCQKKGIGQETILLDAIRNILKPYDSSGHGVELWLPNKKKKIGTAQYCYIGMRSHIDAEKLILGLQGRQINLSFPPSSVSTMKNGHLTPIILKTQRLFLDWADVTRRAYKNNDGDSKTESSSVGAPSRSECTSATEHVNVPGLAIIPNFIPSEQEENVLLAALTGPNAPWAPKQKRQSGDEPVKRRVQHYGYVFDYATADILRERDQYSMGGGGGCPLLPSVRDDVKTDLDVEAFISKSVKALNGWDVFAGVIERTRRTDFRPYLQKYSHDHDEESKNGDQLKFTHINQVTVNEYSPGQGIGSHIDTPSAFGDGLISITLNGGCVMEFRRNQKRSNGNRNEKLRKLIYLPPRSALVMSGPARFDWEHMIVNRRTDTVNGVVIPRKLRVSLTLRTALKESNGPNIIPMELIESYDFPPRWVKPILEESQSANAMHDRRITQNDESINSHLITPECEKNHVHAVYDAIAEQWHHTRGKRGVLWPGATQFLEKLPRGSIVADVGCGDGKYFAAGWSAGCYVIGTDISLPLLQTAMGRSGGADPRQVKYDESGASSKPAIAVADCLNLPIKDGCCDAAICIAVMHHLSSFERRLQCLRELRRIVKNGGVINVQAWAMEQDKKSKRKFAGTDVFVPFNAQPRYLNRVQVENNGNRNKRAEKAKGVAEMYSEAYEGAEFDENKGLVVFKRYCHLYRYGELDELVKQVEGLSLIESGYESGNHFVLVQVLKSLDRENAGVIK